MKTIIITGLFLIVGISIASAKDAQPKLNCTHIGKLTVCTKN